MAVINTDNDFLEAIRWLVSNGQLPVTGVRFVDSTSRKVFDEIVNEGESDTLNDITPDTSTLESALDSVIIEIADIEDDEEIQNIIETQIKKYLYEQLTDVSPNIATIYTQTKSYVDSKPKLATVVQNIIDLHVLAEGIPIDLSTNSGKAKYLRAVLHTAALI